MLLDKINNLKIVPENFESSKTTKIDTSIVRSEMDDIERRFVNGLVRYYKPENILECGVSSGGGSVVLLNAINDMPDARLVSIDRSENYHKDKSLPVGCDVEAFFGYIPTEKWTLIAGKDPCQVLLDSLGQTFDFAVIDTMHAHPCESLNFLCVLPHLKDGAIVVLHDISVFMLNRINSSGRSLCGNGLATRILFSVLAGEKLLPQTKIKYGNKQVHNIGAIQINQDTRRYISNVFHSLSVPWEYFPSESDIKDIRSYLSNYYEKSLMEQFDDAMRWNKLWVLDRSKA